MKNTSSTGHLAGPVLRSLLVLALGTGLASAKSCTYQYYRFKPTKLRSSTALVQLSEFQFFNGANAVSTTGVTVTDANNVAAHTGTSETPEKVIDGVTTTKWLDNAYLSSDLTFAFPAPTTIDGYNYTTANDFSDRDPVSWTIEGSTDNSNWVLIDRINNTTPTATRLTKAYTANFVFPVTISPLITEFDISDSTQGFIFKNGVQVQMYAQTSLATSAVVTGPGGFSLSIPVPDDGAPVNFTPPANSDSTYTLTATSGSGASALSTTATQFIRTVSGATLNYRYVRYTPVQTRGNGTAFQLSNFQFTNAGVKVPVINATSAATSPANEGVLNLIDTEVPGTATKFFTNAYKPVIFDFGSSMAFDSYSFSTANDSPDRDPVKWTIEGSLDNVNFTQIENMTTITYPTTTVRNSASPSIPFPGSSAPPSVQFTTNLATVLPGEAVTLNWVTTGATSFAITGVATTGLTGSVVVNPSTTTTYTATATSAAGVKTTATVTINIVTNPTGVINYPTGFDSATEIATVGTATILNDFATFPNNPNAKRLRLTYQAGSQTGAAWEIIPVKLSDGFSTEFDAQLVNSQFVNGADGLAFTIQNTAAGYKALPTTELLFPSNSVTVALDSFNDHAANGETMANLEVFTGTTQQKIVNLDTDGPFPYAKGAIVAGSTKSYLTTGVGVAPYHVKIDYVPGFLSVSIDGHLVIDKLAIDLGTLGAVDPATGKGYVGFTARTGGLSEFHDIDTWTLTPTVTTPVLPLAVTSSVFTFGTTNSLALTWDSNAGKTYRITESSDLVTWTAVGSNIPSAGTSTNTTINFTKGAKDFFRVEEVTTP